MPDFNEAAVAVVSLFDAAMNERHPDVQRFYDNQQRKNPPAVTAPWIRFSILGGGARLPELGSRMTDELGRAVAQIFTPVGTGDELGRTIAASVKNAMQSVRVGEVQLYETTITVAQGDQGSPWRQINASTKFRFESTPA